LIETETETRKWILRDVEDKEMSGTWLKITSSLVETRNWREKKKRSVGGRALNRREWASREGFVGDDRECEWVGPYSEWLGVALSEVDNW
jgi:hypothetical protein